MSAAITITLQSVSEVLSTTKQLFIPLQLNAVVTYIYTYSNTQLALLETASSSVTITELVLTY